MEQKTCLFCRKPKANLTCVSCECDICKSCAEFVTEESFSFLPQLPPDISVGVYCPPCFDSKVSPSLKNYQEVLKRARNIEVYFSEQGKETRLIKRKEKPLLVSECPDKDEALMRLAFLAARAGFSMLVDVELTSEKVRNEGYQTLKWKGRGVPTNGR